MPELVSDLSRKLGLLQAFGPLKNREQLAQALGVKQKTLQWWIGGDASRAPGAVPTKHLATLERLFANCLPDGLPIETVRALVLGPADNLERAFRDASLVSLADLIEREGQRVTSRIRRRGVDLGLVEVDRPAPPAPSIKLDERFQLIFTTGRTGHCLVLENARQAWGIVAFADGSPARKERSGDVIVPGQSNGSDLWLYESTDRGRHRFACFVSPEPYPLTISDYARLKKSPDKVLLDDLALFYARQPQHLREIHVLDVEMRRP